jgi:hypothetical protein
MFDRSEYDLLANIVFRPGYPGFKPDVKELPNGDGKIDEKKYAHISLKNLANFGTSRERTLLLRTLFVAHEAAEQVADALEVPQAFRPDIRYGAVRVLAYPAKTGLSHRHTDFDLFTIPLFRDVQETFRTYPQAALDWSDQDQRERFYAAEDLAPGLHLGELGEAIGLGPATPHEVLPHDEGQLSMVYFAIPDWDTMMPKQVNHMPLSVKNWLNERMARSRTAFRSYE